MAASSCSSGTCGAFATDLYQEVLKGRNRENVIFSPLSIFSALGLLYMGSSGKTKQEMAATLKIPEDKNMSTEFFRQLLLKFQNNAMLSVANKVYIQSTYELHSKFKEMSVTCFKSDAENIDFSQSIMAAKTINDWVESQTNKKIQDLISPDDLDADSRMVLINAIYFKGFWQNQFKKEFTTKSDFWINENESIQIDMMSNNKAKFAYGFFDDLDARAVELPFQGAELSMFIILPNSRTGLPLLESKLINLQLSTLRERMHMEEVIVSMPRFKIEFKIELNDILSEIGMGSIFTNDAEFSELLNCSDQLKVSKVVHKAFIDVNEEGAEAAAATGIMIARMCLMMPVEFCANHPFYFAIIDRSHEIIFNGSLKKIELVEPMY